MYGFYGWGGTVLILQIVCIVHAVRTDRTGWIWIILIFPLIGSIVYVASEVRLGRGSSRLARQIVDVVQPSRRLEALRAEVEATPSVENRLALAEECVRHKLYSEALRLYDSALTGVHFRSRTRSPRRCRDIVPDQAAFTVGRSTRLQAPASKPRMSLKNSAGMAGAQGKRFSISFTIKVIAPVNAWILS
jgi:hypothetical protein